MPAKVQDPFLALRLEVQALALDLYDAGYVMRGSSLIDGEDSGKRDDESDADWHKRLADLSAVALAGREVVRIADRLSDLVGIPQLDIREEGGSA